MVLHTITILKRRAYRYSNPPLLHSNDKDGPEAYNPHRQQHRVPTLPHTRCEATAVERSLPKHSMPAHVPAQHARPRSYRGGHTQSGKQIRSPTHHIRAPLARHHAPDTTQNRTPPLQSSRAVRIICRCSDASDKWFDIDDDIYFKAKILIFSEKNVSAIVLRSFSRWSNRYIAEYPLSTTYRADTTYSFRYRVARRESSVTYWYNCSFHSSTPHPPSNRR